MGTPNWLRLTGRAINQNQPAIFSGLAVAGVVATAVLTVRATKQACERLEFVKATPREAVETCWKLYIPAGLAGASTVAFIIAANQVANRKYAAMAGAYTLVDTAYREYRQAVVEEFGEAKERAARDRVAARRIDENPPKDGQVIITGGGDTLCYETLMGRYFRSDIETIRQLANGLNRDILGGQMYASLNEFFGMLGLAPTAIGEELGFNCEHLVEPQFSSHLAQDGTPCLALQFATLPVKEYTKY